MVVIYGFSWIIKYVFSFADVQNPPRNGFPTENDHDFGIPGVYQHVQSWYVSQLSMLTFAKPNTLPSHTPSRQPVGILTCEGEPLVDRS